MIRPPLRLLPLLAALLCLLAAQGARAQIHELGNLGTAPDGSYSSIAIATNASGQVVGGCSVYDAQGNTIGWHAFLYSNGKMKDLGSLGRAPDGSSYSTARAINSAGSVVGESDVYDSQGNYRGQHAFLYRNGQMQDLGAFGTGIDGLSYSYAEAINTSGQIAGESEVFDDQGNDKGSHAFLYSNGQMNDLGTLGSTADGSGNSAAVALNDSGQVAGGSDVYDAQDIFRGYGGFLYSNGQMQNLGNLGVDGDGVGRVFVEGMNASGQVVGGSYLYDSQGHNEGFRAFLYSDGQMRNLGTLDQSEGSVSYSYALAVNDSGQITGAFGGTFGSAGDVGGQHAFLYRDGQMQDLGALSTTPDGTSGSLGIAINATGQVAGESDVWLFDHGNSHYGGHHTFLYANGQMQDLGTFGTAFSGRGYSSQLSLNASGRVVGYSEVFDAQGNDIGAHAFATNQPPVAAADSYSTLEDTPIIVGSAGVMANDSDMDGDPLTASLVTTTTNGMLTFSSNGSFKYTPNANYNGTDSFTYRVNDGTANSTPATVTITVTPVNDPPVAANDTDATTLNTPVTIAVLYNDTDIDGDSITVTGVSQPTNGAVTIVAGATVTYTPRNGFVGTDTFTYAISDGHGGAASASVSVTVSKPNHPPQAITDSLTTSPNTPATIAPLANDHDPDGDPLTMVSITQPSGGTAVINANGTVTYTPAHGFRGHDTFTYQVSDGRGGTDVGRINVQVH